MYGTMAMKSFMRMMVTKVVCQSKRNRESKTVAFSFRKRGNRWEWLCVCACARGGEHALRLIDHCLCDLHRFSCWKAERGTTHCTQRNEEEKES